MIEDPQIAQELLATLQAKADTSQLEGMARFGIAAHHRLGIRMPVLRTIAKPYRKRHELSALLWESPIGEAKLLAAMVGDPDHVTEEQMDAWVLSINSWEVCDCLMGELFEPSKFSYAKAHEWSQRPEEFVKRSGFVLMAWLAVHRKKEADQPFLEFLPHIQRESEDPRNFVKKAVNWALRQLGKRSAYLHPHALNLAALLKDSCHPTARWIGTDAYRELSGDKVKQKLGL